jgi:alpha-tubulin suppressor-like RCC1 family protein
MQQCSVASPTRTAHADKVQQQLQKQTLRLTLLFKTPRRPASATDGREEQSKREQAGANMRIVKRGLFRPLQSLTRRFKILAIVFAAAAVTQLSSSAAEAYLWTYPSSGGIGAIYGAPAIATDGTVYVSTQTGYLYAINPNGTLKWNFSISAAAQAGPSVATDGTVYVPADKKLFAVNPNGTQKWVFDTSVNGNPAWTSFPVYSTATIARDGTIYFGAGIAVYALNSSGVQKWQSYLNGEVYGAPVIGFDGTVYAFENGSQFVALRPENGSRKWTQYTYSGEAGPALGYAGPIYVPGRTDPGYNISSFNLAGGVNWQITAGFIDYSSCLALDASSVSFGGILGGGIYAVNPNGTTKWFAGYGDSSTPAVSSNGRLYIGDGDGYVYALQQSNGTLLWTYNVGSSVYTSPALGTDGRLYVGTIDGRVLAFSGAGSPTTSSWPQYAKNPQRTGAMETLAISAGQYHSLALKRDGTVWAWGQNSSGKLGDGTTIDRSTPVQVSSLTSVIAISAGGGHNLALKSDGTVWGWGGNSWGQIGDGTTTARSTPVQVSGLSSVIAVSAGGYHSLAIKSDGTVWAWGHGYYGELGQGNSLHYYSPVQVPGFSTAISISAGLLTSAVVKRDGTIWGFGYNSYSEIGDGTTTWRYSPVQTIGISNANAVSLGDYHGLALKNDGTLWAWGNNSWGQIGDGTTVNRSTAVQTLVSSVSRFAAGAYSSIATKTDGNVLAWGYNVQGQLGDGTTTDRSTPVTVLTGAIAAETGTYHSISLQSDLTLKGWGYNGYGQVGDGTTTQRYTPVTVTGLGL